MKYNLLVLLVGAFLLSACGQDDGQAEEAGMDTGTETTAAEESGGVSPEVAKSGEVKDSGLGYEYVVVDHSADEKEFRLRQSIAGKEALIEHYEENDWETAELEKELEELKQKLANLGSGN